MKRMNQPPRRVARLKEALANLEASIVAGKKPEKNDRRVKEMVTISKRIAELSGPKPAKAVML